VHRSELEVIRLSRRRGGISADLIKIKASTAAPSIMAPHSDKESFMPIDTIVVVLMAAAFGIFAATLYWADLRTRELSR
jgi:hypothetical protein